MTPLKKKQNLQDTFDREIDMLGKETSIRWKSKELQSPEFISNLKTLLKKMLRINPAMRCSVEEALADPIFDLISSAGESELK